MSYARRLTQETWVRLEETRAREIQKRWELYDGDHPKPLLVRPATSRSSAIDDNVTPNMIGVVVDRSNGFLFGQAPSFSLPLSQQTAPGAGATGEVEVSPEEQYLDDVWAANRRKVTLLKLGLNGAVAGHAYMRLYLPDVETKTKAGKVIPRLIPLDPASVTCLWDDNDIDKVLAYKIEWRTVTDTGEDAVSRQLIERDDTGRSWSIVEEHATGDQPFIEGARSTWPYPFSPIVDCQNLPRPNEFYGVSDMDGGLADLNAQLNRMISNLSRIVRFHAHPKTWASGMSTADLRNMVVDPEGVIGLPHPEATLQNLEMESDLTGALAVLSQVKGLLHEIARSPDLSTEKMEGIGQLSGLALKLLYAPLLERTEQKRGTYGDMLEEINRRLLTIGKFGDYDPTLTVQISWPDPLPVDEKAEAETLLLHKTLGASQHTLLEKAGYDAEIEAERSEDEAQISMEHAGRALDAGSFGVGDRTGRQTTGTTTEE